MLKALACSRTSVSLGDHPNSLHLTDLVVLLLLTYRPHVQTQIPLQTLIYHFLRHLLPLLDHPLRHREAENRRYHLFQKNLQ